MIRITPEQIATLNADNAMHAADGAKGAIYPVALIRVLLDDYALLCEVAEAADALDRWARTDRLDAALDALRKARG